MSKLFIELYLDEDVSVLVADLMRARGFSVTTTRQENQLGKSDAEQLAYATYNAKVLLTHNRVDFERLAQSYFETGREHSGIIIATRHAPQEIARRLLFILDQITADEMRNHLRYI